MNPDTREVGDTCPSSVCDRGPERGGQADGTLAHPVFTKEILWKVMEEIKADSQAMLFMPGPTQRNILENFVKTGEKRLFKIREDHGEERRWDQGHHLVLLRHNLVWTDGFLPRQVSPIPYLKQHWDSDTHIGKWSHLPWGRLGSHLTS